MRRRKLGESGNLLSVVSLLERSQCRLHSCCRRHIRVLFALHGTNEEFVQEGQMNGHGSFATRIFRRLDALLKKVFGHNLSKVIGVVLFVGYPTDKLIFALVA